MAKRITNKVTWVGKVDWELVYFHGKEYSTDKGSSYNSYLIRDKKTVLMDTVWGPYDREFVERLKEEIDLKDIEDAIPKTLQDNIFDLTQFILNQKIDEARSLVRDLTLQGEDEIKLIAVMLGQFRIFTQVKLLAENGRAESQIVSDLSDYLGRKVNPYQVKFAIRDVRSLSLSFLKKTIVCLIETDYQIKSGLYDKDYLFDLALLKIATANL